MVILLKNWQKTNLRAKTQKPSKIGFKKPTTQNPGFLGSGFLGSAIPDNNTTWNTTWNNTTRSLLGSINKQTPSYSL